jgi:hypothetical protein
MDAEMLRLTELAGRKFGSWNAEREVERNKNKHRVYWCRCDCGTERKVVAQTLRDGKSVSCGCTKGTAIAKARTKHGHATMRQFPTSGSHGRKHGHTANVDGVVFRSKTYTSWEAMKKRCDGKSENSRRYYVRYGVKVCDRWMDFRNFLADMGEAPEGMTLDRYPDNTGNYEPGNCRWATQQQQNDNRRTKGHVVRVASTEELVEELERRGFIVQISEQKAA